MKNHFSLLFDSSHRRFTISFFLTAIILIIASQIIGTTDYLPGIISLMAGMVLLFFTFLHPWKNWKNYIILFMICLVLILLTFLIIYILDLLNYEKFISEGVVMAFIGLICIPGILAGIIGAIYCEIKK